MAENNNDIDALDVNIPADGQPYTWDDAIRRIKAVLKYTFSNTHTAGNFSKLVALHNWIILYNTTFYDACVRIGTNTNKSIIDLWKIHYKKITPPIAPNTSNLTRGVYLLTYQSQVVNGRTYPILWLRTNADGEHVDGPAGRPLSEAYWTKLR